MLDVNEKRRTNLRLLIEQHGTAIVLGRLEITKQTLSQYAGRNPNRNIGTSFARRIEREFNLQNGWLDNIHHGSTAFNAVVELATQLDESQLKNLVQLLNATIAMSPKRDE